ncbi:prepilin peptidase [Qipengyuania sp. 6B39]|uniref:A24 family peptidase n=1 Tax=Qipengyuania proteolytica TaxID=2867239 RepID=UPI001C8A3BD3|nr:prepilin peptidase [Qipengyuania proteolytica]MBX7496684.1 prepilin peptidase [Qipengyuania proteolytica]
MAGIEFTYVLLGALAIALVVAAFTDLRSRQIGNRLNAGIALAAPLWWWASGVSLWPGVVWQVGFAALVFAICCVLFAIRQMGGGDVKLLTALALWIPPLPFLKLVVIMAIVGGVLTVLFGAAHIIRRRKDRIAIPYGVAIAIAALWVLGTEPLGQMPAVSGML